jgi:hypothetical protein
MDFIGNLIVFIFLTFLLFIGTKIFSLLSKDGKILWFDFNIKFKRFSQRTFLYIETKKPLYTKCIRAI